MGDHSCDEMKPHAIMVEFLFQGHINPFINLAIGLASKGCTVTYVQTEYTYHRMSKANLEQSGSDDLFSGARKSGLDIHHTTISDGFALDFDRDGNFFQFYESIVLDFPARVEELIGKMVEESSRGKTKPFIVADAAYLWPPAVAAKYNIMYVSLWASPAQRLLIGYHLELLKENAILTSYDDFEDQKQEITGAKLSNVRDFIRYCPRENDPFFPAIIRDSIIKAHLEVRKADFILYNTIEELESEAISALNHTLQTTTYAVGPTNFLVKDTVLIPTINSLRSETDCTGWLDSKPPGSVLFVSFGSIAQIDKQVIHEIAHGLHLSQANFLWVLRPDMVGEESEKILPTGFQDDLASGKGLMIPWCNQCDVLASRAVGGFLTHCGWSSILEGIWYGVPMICHPFYMDQPTNRNMAVDDWKIGINLCDGQQISREEVAKKVDSLMSGKELEALIRVEMKKVNKIVHHALAKNGSSDANLDKFLSDLKAKI